MKFETTPVQGAILVAPDVYADGRGFFMESWNQRRFQEAGYNWQFVQDNHSRSRRGILRGMHFQTRQTQGKLVRVTAGAVHAVVVDLRKSSPSFGGWFGVELSAANQHLLFAPKGCAHGFYVLSESADFLYKTTDYYHPESELTLAWDDPTIGIDWPVPTGESPSLSEKDAQGLSWADIPYFD